MRDLAARLRAIVSADAGRPRGATPGVDPRGRPFDLVDIAGALGGDVHDVAGGACIVVDRTWDPYWYHGRRKLEWYAIDPASPIALFEPRLAALDDWASRVVFFDIETTGLSGGAGTIAFLAGFGWFEDGGFRVRQFLLSGPAGESAMLDAVARLLDDASLLVTFNGRTFDVPFMDMRWAFHRKDNPTSGLPHFDMLPPARRLWGRRDLADHDSAPLESAAAYGSDHGSGRGREGCSLGALERSVLGFHRLGDVPGFEIPTRYFQFLRSGDATVIEGVLEHNRHDLLSLAAIMSHALRLASDGPDECREPAEQVALGRLYERAGDTARASHAFELAARCDDRVVRGHALARLAVLLRREARYDESAAAWQGVLDRPSDGRPLTILERRAAEALAIHHEHRGRDLGTARRYAEALREPRPSSGLFGARTFRSAASPAQVEHRLARLDRKLKRKTGRDTKGGPEAAPLLRDSS